MGDEGYASEELVAELGSAFLCADLGITPEVREDHAAYIASWLEGAEERQALHLLSAAAHAQRAADYLHALQPEKEPEPPEAVLRAMEDAERAIARCSGSGLGFIMPQGQPIGGPPHLCRSATRAQLHVPFPARFFPALLALAAGTWLGHGARQCRHRSG